MTYTYSWSGFPGGFSQFSLSRFIVFSFFPQKRIKAEWEERLRKEKEDEEKQTKEKEEKKAKQVKHQLLRIGSHILSCFWNAYLYIKEL